MKHSYKDRHRNYHCTKIHKKNYNRVTETIFVHIEVVRKQRRCLITFGYGRKYLRSPAPASYCYNYGKYASPFSVFGDERENIGTNYIDIPLNCHNCRILPILYYNRQLSTSSFFFSFWDPKRKKKLPTNLKLQGKV